LSISQYFLKNSAPKPSGPGALSWFKEKIAE